MRFASLLIALLLSPFCAAAQDKIIIAECAAGGCRCALSGLTSDEMAVLTENAPPQSAADYVVIFDQGKLHWSPLSLAEIDRIAGGDGQCALEVFGSIPPDNGQWLGTVRAQNLQGCPAQVASMVPPIVAKMAYSGRVDWQGNFDPAKLIDPEAKQPVRWQQRRPDLYKGTLLTAAPKDVLEVTGDLTALPLSSKHTTTTMHLRIAAKGANAGALAALGLKDCRVTAIYDYRLAE